MKNFSKKTSLIAKNTDHYLKNFILKQKNNSGLVKAMKYGIFSGGKRFRSIIVVNVGKIFGIDYKKLIIIGSAIECIHSYSLIHDDLPSMDNDDFRRGKLSAHKKFNESTAILAGNSLLTLAFEILAGRELLLSQNIKNELVKTLANTSGHSGLAGGQYSDLNLEKKKISKKKIIDMQTKKTGHLFGFCFESVAIAKNMNFNRRKELKNLGLDIGLLFQISDDLIDYEDEKDKITLVNFLGYTEALNFANNLKKKINKKIKKYGNKANSLLKIVEFILKRKF